MKSQVGDSKVIITTFISKNQGQSYEHRGRSINVFPPPLSDFKAEIRLTLWSQMPKIKFGPQHIPER